MVESVVVGCAVVEERDKWGTKLEVTFSKYMQPQPHPPIYRYTHT